MTSEARVTLRVTRHFDAPPERVFDAWLDPETAGRWLFASPTGQMVRVEIDARVGGTFRFIRRDAEDIEHVGEYLEIDRARRLVFTFAVPKFSAEITRVSIAIAPAAGGCDLALTHEGVLPEWASRTEAGWTMILDRLATLLPGDYGTRVGKGTVRFERLLPGPIERVWAYLVQSEKRGTWLASGEMEQRVGGSVTLRFHHTSLSVEQVPPPERYRKLESGHVGHHRVTHFDPPRLLGLTWSDGADDQSEVVFELTEEGNSVRLVLTHRRLADRAAEVGVATGWHTHLGVLVARLSGREPRPFWSAFADIDGEYEKRFNRGNE